MKGRHCIGLNWRNLLGYVSLNQYNVFLSYSREEIRLVENSRGDYMTTFYPGYWAEKYNTLFYIYKNQ